MTVFQLVLSEIRYRRLNFILSLLAVTVAAALFVTGPTLISGYTADTRNQLEEMQAKSDKELAEMDKKTRRIMRDIGINLRIVHKDTVMGGLYTDFKAVPFEEEDIKKLATAEKINKIVHIVGTLQEKITWNGRSVFIVGMMPMLTNSQKNEEKPHMVKNIKEGTVLVGYELAGDLKEGDTLDIEGHQLKIAKIVAQFGDVQDAQLLMHLHDAQKILKQPGKINQILALNCKCEGNRISAIRQELEGVLPYAKVTEITNRATARENQRNLVSKKRKGQLALLKENRDRWEQSMSTLLGIVTPSVVLVAATFIGLLTWLNVRERRPEIGLLRALGKGSLNIASLFLGKSAILGLLGGMIGCGLGYGLASWVGSSQMGIPSEYFPLNPLLMLATIVGTPLVAAMASYLPTLSAVTQDPAVVLMDN